MATYRRANEADAGPVAALWKQVFGDDEGAVNAILVRFAGEGNVYVAEEEGALVAHLLSVPCFAGEYEGIYLYALATHPDYRGRSIMGGLMTHAEKESLAAGAAFSCLIPASESLFDYYAAHGYKKMEMRLLRCHVPGAYHEDITFGRLLPEQFISLRGSFLKSAYPSLMPISFSPGRTAFLLEDLWAGGFEAARGHRGYAIFQGGEAPFVAELAAEGEKEATRLLAAIAHRTGRREQVLTLPLSGGPFHGDGTSFGEVQVKWIDASDEAASLHSKSGKTAEPDLYLRFALDDAPQRMAQRGLI